MDLKLTQLTLQGFKSFGKEQNIRFGDITIFIGANGSGKSNLMSFFEMLNYAMTKGLSQFVITHGESASFTHLGNLNRMVNAKLTFKSDTHKNTYAFSLSPTLNNYFVFTGEELTTQKAPNGAVRSQHLDNIQRESALPDFLKSGVEDQVNIKAIFTILRKCNFFQFHNTSLDSQIRQDSYINNAGYLMSNGGNLAAFLYGMQQNSNYKEYYERIVYFIRLAYPPFKDFILTPKISNPNFIRLDWQDKNSPPNYRFGPHQISDGTIRFMALASLLLQPPKTIPNVIVIDEPELGLHPSAISTLANMIHVASKNCQVILATQSSQLLDYFEPRNIRVVEREESNSVVTVPDKEQLDYWLENYSLGQIWEKNIIGGRP